MVERNNTKGKQQSSANNKSFNDQNQTKVSFIVVVFFLFCLSVEFQIVLRRLPPTLTSEQFLEIVSPLPDHDYYRFCKADIRYFDFLFVFDCKLTNVLLSQFGSTICLFTRLFKHTESSRITYFYREISRLRFLG